MGKKKHIEFRPEREYEPRPDETLDDITEFRSAIAAGMDTSWDRFVNTRYILILAILEDARCQNTQQAKDQQAAGKPAAKIEPGETDEGAYD